MLVHYRPACYEALSADEHKAVFAGYRALAEDPRPGQRAAPADRDRHDDSVVALANAPLRS